MAFMTPDQIAAAEKKAQDDRLMAKKQQEDAILAKRLLEEKQANSPEAKAERKAENDFEWGLFKFIGSCAAGAGGGVAGYLAFEELCGAETTQGDPSDPDGKMITQLGNQALAVTGSSPLPTALNILSPKQPNPAP